MTPTLTASLAFTFGPSSTVTDTCPSGSIPVGLQVSTFNQQYASGAEILCDAGTGPFAVGTFTGFGYDDVQNLICPPGSLLVGLRGRLGAIFDAVGTRCAASGSPAADGPISEGPGGGPAGPADCPGGLAMNALTITTGGFEFSFGDASVWQISGSCVDYIAFHPATSGVYGGTQTLSASTFAQQPVNLGAAGADCSLSGNVLTYVHAGSDCTVSASADNAETVSAGITIDPRPLTVTADNKTRPYGVANPTFTHTDTGFINGDTFATPPTCGSTATVTSPPGHYPITCSGAVEPDYAISYVAGTLTITKANVTLHTSSTTASSFRLSGRMTFTTTVTNSASGNPVSGLAVTIAVKVDAFYSVKCTSNTNASGVATCSTGNGNLLLLKYPHPYTATTPATVLYNAGSTTGTIYP